MKVILLSAFVLFNSNFLFAGEDQVTNEARAQKHVEEHCHLSKADFDNYRKKYDTGFIVISACLADESGKTVNFVMDYSKKIKDGPAIFLASLVAARASGRDLDEILAMNKDSKETDKTIKKLNIKRELYFDRLNEMRLKLNLEPNVYK